jgi:exonuclease VII small subunit
MNRFVVAVLVSLFLSSQAFCQTSATASEHMSLLNGYQEKLSESYMEYMSQVAHGARARKMEKKRAELISSIRDAIRQAGKIQPYKGDASLRDAYRQTWSVQLNIFEEDYHKVLDMEEIAERSYDAMEQYLLIQEKAAEKLDLESDKLDVAYKGFAAAHNVTLVDGGHSKLGKKLVKAGRVNSYMTDIFLIYFKSNVQESLVIEALNKKDINALEQAKNSLLKFSTEGLMRLDSVKPFEDDRSLIETCRKVLAFQKQEAGKLAVYSEFILQQQEMDQAKKTFDAKPAASRNQKDVDQYNFAINNYNNAIKNYNKVNDELNATRTKVHNDWEDARKRFRDRHTPHHS